MYIIRFIIVDLVLLGFLGYSWVCDPKLDKQL